MCVRGARAYAAIGEAAGRIEEQVWSDKIASAETHGPQPIDVRRHQIGPARGDRRIGKRGGQGLCGGGNGRRVAFEEVRCPGESLRRSAGIARSVTRNSSALDIGFEAEDEKRVKLKVVTELDAADGAALVQPRDTGIGPGRAAAIDMAERLCAIAKVYLKAAETQIQVLEGYCVKRAGSGVSV